MKWSVLLVVCFLCVSINAYTWSDCAAPLTNVIYFEDVELEPSVPVVNERLSFNIRASLVDVIMSAETSVELIHDGKMFINSTTRDVCTLLEHNDLSCPIPAGKFSYTYVVDNVPHLPGGHYDVYIKHFIGSTVLGCLKVSLDLVEPNPEQCVYTAGLSVSLRGQLQHEMANAPPAERQLGDWVQVGPRGLGGSTIAWGTFDSIEYDVLPFDPTINRDLFVWGINGTISRAAYRDSVQESQTYTGEFFVGFLLSGRLPGDVEIIFKGPFEWTLTHVGNRLTGSVKLYPQQVQGRNFTYPVAAAFLSPFTLDATQSGIFRLSASTTLCRCGVDPCGVCNGDGGSCAAAITDDGNLSLYAQGAIGVSVAGLIIVVAAIAFFVWRMRKPKEEPGIDDMDLADPQKPDYGTMAINEVIQDGNHVA